MNQLPAKRKKPLKIVFLDRDGVINVFPGKGNYVTRVKDFQFLPGSLEAIRDLTERGYTLFVISNQAGVGKGVFTQNKLDRITRKMLNGIEKSGGCIRKVYYSTGRPDSGCPDRKPKTGSISKALKFLNADQRVLKTAFFVGDTQGDIQTGINAGCQTVFVLTGRENRADMRRHWTVRPDYIAQDLRGAARHIYQFHGETWPEGE